MVTIDEITERLRAGLIDRTGLDQTVKLDLRGQGVIHIAGKVVTNVDGPADCTLVVSLEDLVALAAGRLDPAMAMMRGRLKVIGDASVALKLQPFLARARDSL